MADRIDSREGRHAGGQDAGNNEVGPLLTEDYGEPIIYGLDIQQSSHHAHKHKHNNTALWVIIAAVAIALAIVAAFFLMRALKSSKEAAQTAPIEQKATEAEETEQAAKETEQAKVEEVEAKQEAPAEDNKAAEASAPSDEPNSDEILQLASKLSFDGKDLSIPVGDLAVEVKGGRVQVSHTPGNGIDPYTMTVNASCRAAALAKELAERKVIGADEKDANPFSQVTWIVRDQKGDSYLAVCYNADDIPTSGEGLSVLDRSPRYRLSDSVYDALGKDVPQERGETPSLLNGTYIWSTAVV